MKNTPDDITSLLISIAIFFGMISLAIANLYFVNKAIEDKYFIEKHYMMQIFYQGLEKHKAAYYYWSIFILRRCSLSFIIVFFKESTSFQIHSLLIQSMLMLMYATKYKIFLSKIENFLLIFNEIMIFIAVLHMIVFSDAFDLSL